MAAGGVLVGRGYVSIRPEFEGDWSRSVSSRASNAGRSASGAFSKAFGAGLKGIGALAGVAIGANLASAAAGAAALAPALATAGAAAGALKLGLSGVGDAFKAAFADQSADANAAASATRAVESAQRGLAKAQQGLADARVQAAERVKEAQKAVGEAEQNLARTVEESAQRQKDAQQSVLDAERNLKDAQVDARQAQQSLNEARNEAVRSLQDMNDQLAGARLDEREAVLRQVEAEKALRAAQGNPGVTPEQLAKLQLAYDRATLNLSEQRRETKQLAADTAKANKAGVEGSKQVTQAKDRIAQANQTVVDRERDLVKAREQQRRTAVDSARDIADAQQGVADAQAGVAKARQEGARQIRDAEQAVADAAQAVSDAQAAAAAQTSKVDQAMAKLAPNAQAFVRTIQGLAPAWDSMRLSVQNELFKGLDRTVSGLASTTLPILKEQLTATAGIWNHIAKNAAAGIQEMAKSGRLREILKGANDNLRVFQDTPKQLITAFGQLTVAAQPAFNGLLQQLAGAITHFTDGIAASFTSGGLKDAIDTAFGILSQFGTLLGNAFGVVVQLFKAASDAGGQIVGVLGSVFGELKSILAAPEMQAQLRNLFASVAQIVGAIVPVIGTVVQAAIPLISVVVSAVAEIAKVLGPVLQQLVTALGAALMPIFQALKPVLVTITTAIIGIVQAVIPLLQPIANLIAAVINALAPALTPIINVITELVQVLVGPLTQVVQSLTPLLATIGKIIAGVFRALEPFLTPLADLLGQVAGLIANVFAVALDQLMQALRPLLPVGMQLINSILGGLTPILPTLGVAFRAIADALLAIIVPLGGVAASLSRQLAPILAQLAPMLGAFAETLSGALAQILPVLTGALLTLVKAALPLLPLVGQLVGMFLDMAAGVYIQLLPSLLELLKAAVQLTVALLPIVTLGVKITALLIRLSITVLKWLLPPLLTLIGTLVGGLASALSSTVGRVAGVIRVIAELITWIERRLGPSLKWLNDKIVQPVWRAIQTVITWSWNNVIKPTFTGLRQGVTSVGNAFRWLRDSAVKPAFSAVSSTVNSVWKNGIRPAFDALKSAIGQVAKAFGSAKDAIGKAWAKIKDLTKAPINFVLNSVWNHGVVKAWDKILGWIPGLPKLKELPLLASGGTLPVQPGIFNSPTAIVGEGNPKHPEYVIPTDPKYRARAFALWQAAGGQLMEDGGILGSVWGGIKNVGGAIKGAITSAADFLKNPAEALDNLMGRLLKPLTSIKNSAWGKLALGIPKSILKGLKDLVTFSGGGDEGGNGGNIGGTIPKGNRLAIISQALAAAGVPPPGSLAQWQAGLNTLITRESGWNPNAINRWDSNAKAGHPSQGLAQTIPGTWSAYVPGSLRSRGILDPVANVAAAVRYIVSRYGNITNVQQANANRPPAGYDSGGWLPTGLSTVYNGTGRPEPVLTGAQWNAVMAGGQGLDGVTVNVWVGNQQITDITRAEIRDSQQQLISVLTAS